MKFLVVFVTVLVLVAHGKVLTADELSRVNTIELQPGDPLELTGYAVEAAAVQQQPRASVGETIQVFGAEEGQKVGVPQESQRAYQVDSPEVRQLDAEAERALSDGIYIPILTGVCTNSVCSYICSILSFKNSNCASTNTCQCTN